MNRRRRSAAIRMSDVIKASKRLLLGTALLAIGTTASAEDWKGWMGSKRDGVLHESGVVDSIPAAGLPVKWRHPVGAGYAGPAVADGKVFVTDYLTASGKAFNDPGQRAKLQGRERLLALDEKSGEVIWEYAYDRPYEISYPSGPRATPTIDGNRVYFLGAEGDFTCLNTNDGSVVWKRNLSTDFGADVPIWGFSAHPLVHGDLIYTMVGGDGQGIVAFDKNTGEVSWKALDVPAGYCAPIIVDAGGTSQLITFHPEGVTSFAPETGKKYWDIPVSPSYEMSVAVPAVNGNHIFVSSIHTEAVLIELASDTPTAKEVWRGESKNAVHCSNAPASFKGDVIYGTDCNQGDLIAVDASNGNRLWSTFEATKPGEKRFIKHGTAFLTRVGDSDSYFVMSENGDLIVAELTSKGFAEKGRMHVLEPTGEAFGRPVVWSYPAYANRTAYIRNDKEIVAVNLSAK
ncbi:PQQ-like beta-propeller repeat protein [Stieleria sp. JC731]|uniref:outer membrane protein assembly factor BamB family protein n=1 Tax=Pirellulaceae TaxID=2691357 RepID=UPI001E6389DF|nr:PQQ-binding-like beta-propeller repeat protein [Stieleria sp. JC731]MCC9601639.1 PQQ-like beta-propeller repeat protein [Stieleria sp. JC731]